MASSDNRGSGTGDSSSGVLLQCSMCSVPYDTSDHEPKLLACHHSYCLMCIQELSKNRAAFRCPESDCRKKTEVPKDGVISLPKNFYVLQMRNFVVHTPKATEKSIPSTKSNSGKTSVTLDNTCQKHMNQPLLFFCDTCMVPICMNCTVLDHDKNGGHKIKDIASAVKVHHDILQSKMSKMDRSMNGYSLGLRLLKTELSNLETTRETSLTHLQETFRQLSLKLDARREILEKQVEDTYKERKEAILTQAQVFKSQTERVSELHERCAEIVGSSNLTDAVQAATNPRLMATVDAVCQTPTDFSVNDKSYIQFQYESGLHNFVEAVTKVGSIQCDHALPSRIKYDIPQCMAGIKCTISATVKSLKGEALGNCPITAKITDPDDDELSYKISSDSNGVYNFEIRPQMSGTHKICLQFLEFPIWGQETEFEVRSNDPVMVIGLQDDESQLLHPTSVAICNQNNNIFVADMGNKRVQVFNETGKSLAGFKIGSNKATAYDIKINNANEEILFTKVGPGETGQMHASTICIFSLTGEKKQQFNNGELRKAMFLAVNSKGQIITTDTVLNAFYIHSKEGVPIKKIGSQGSGPSQFNFPSSICIGKEDSIIISDTGNNRVQIFNKVGKLLHEFGSNQPEERSFNKGSLISPRGIAADNHCILVADSQNRIQIFKYDGTFVACIESKGDPINEPYGLTLTKDGHVLLADFKNNSVKKYRYK